jgi:hypothetical protein
MPLPRRRRFWPRAAPLLLLPPPRRRSHRTWRRYRRARPAAVAVPKPTRRSAAAAAGADSGPAPLGPVPMLYSDNYFRASDNYKSAASQPRHNMLFRPKRPQPGPRVKGIWGERACWGVRAMR